MVFGIFMKNHENHQKSSKNSKNEWFWTGKYADASLSRALGGKLYIGTSQNYAESIALDEYVLKICLEVL